MSQPLKIFIIYARKDAEFKDELIYHLRPLQLLGLVDTWHDGDLQPGAVWDAEIKSQLRRADVVIPLISTHFINSDYIQGTEFKEARQRWERGEAEITPVVVRDCLWEELASLADLQALPSNGQKILPVTRWPDRDEAWTVIANGLKRLCVEMRARRQQAETAKQEQERREKEMTEAQRRREAEQLRLTEQQKLEALAREKAAEEERRRREEAERQAAERRRKEDAERQQREAEAVRQAEERRRQDEAAWQQACSENTIEAYEYYLGQNSPALQKGEALAAIKQLRREGQSFWTQYRYGILGGAGVLILLLLILLNQKSETPTDTSSKITEKQSLEQIIEPEMVFVEGGAFTMGCTAERGSVCFDSEKPPHKVTLNSFYIGKYEVTQAQWKAVMGSNPSYFKDCDDCPVENVSWNDIQDFLQKLNEKTGKKYRLPTEAEWEYAARGGNKSQKYKYAGSSDPDAVAWNSNNSNSKTHQVSGKSPNELGLYDMSGNVWEWCEDVWHDNYSGAPTDGSAWTTGGDSSRRVVRGGSWGSTPNFCRAAYRNWYYAADRDNLLGFRVAR